MNNNCNYFITYHRSQQQLTLSNDRCWKVHEFLCSSKGWSEQFRIYITAHASSAKTQIPTNRLDATCAGHEQFIYIKGRKLALKFPFARSVKDVKSAWMVFDQTCSQPDESVFILGSEEINVCLILQFEYKFLVDTIVLTRQQGEK